MQLDVKVSVVKCKRKEYSQFPLWDFFECNTEEESDVVMQLSKISQFPLWDFFECNRA